MNSKDALKTIEEVNGNHLDKIYMPSLKRELLFKPLTTADAKTLTRISFLEEFDINVEMIKLSLYDKLCTEQSKQEIIDSKGNKYPPLTSKTLTQIDYLSFLNGIRSLLDNEVSYTFTCANKECNHKWEYTLKIDQLFSEEMFNFERQTEFFEKDDPRTGHVWKFELTNFSMENYIYFRYMIEKIKEKDKENPEVTFESKFVRPILYIKNIWLNDELIEDWPELLITDKLNFYNKISPNITINTKGTKNKTLYDFIRETFIEQKIQDKIQNLTVECPNCHNKYDGMFNFDDFFMF